jgi:uncharacterized cupin superfamily protein
MSAVVTRAKFRVQEVLASHYSTDPNGQLIKDNEVVRLSAVYSANPDSDNHAFWKATPNGRIEMWINNSEAWGTFKPGDEFYVDFVKAEQE